MSNSSPWKAENSVINQTPSKLSSFEGNPFNYLANTILAWDIDLILKTLAFEKPKPNKLHLLLNGSRHGSYARVMKIYSKVISRLVSAYDFYSQVV